MKFIIPFALIFIVTNIYSQNISDSLKIKMGDSLWVAKYKKKYCYYDDMARPFADSMLKYSDKLKDAYIWHCGKKIIDKWEKLQDYYLALYEKWSDKADEVVRAWGREMCECN